MKTCPWIGLVCCLLFASTGCSTYWQLMDPDFLVFHKERAGIGTFPVKDVHPPEPQLPPAPDLHLRYSDESDDGVIYFAHTNEQLHYSQCVERIQKILDKTAGPVNLEIQVGKGDLLWEPRFQLALQGLKGGERLQLKTVQATSATR